MARTTTFKTVLHRVATRRGYDPVNNLERNTADALAEYIRDAYEVGYEWYEWPEAVCIDARYVRNQVIAWDQGGGRDAFGTVFCVTRNHPLKNDNPLPIKFKLGEEGIYLPVAYDNCEVYVSYRKPAPRFTATEYVAATAYAVGDTVYYATTGECYVCKLASTGNLPTLTAYWEVLPLLTVLAAATVQGANAQATAEEGQVSTSLQLDEMFLGYLENELDRIELQSGQTRMSKYSRNA